MAANSAVLGRIWLKFEPVRDIIDVLVTCKYEEDPIKNEDARVQTRLYDAFSDAQEQLTPKSAQIRAHPSFYSWPRYLQKMKKIQPKMKELEC